MSRNRNRRNKNSRRRNPLTHGGSETAQPGCLRDVLTLVRTVGKGDEPVEFDFCQQVVAASSYPAWLYVAIACRLFRNLVDEAGLDLDSLSAGILATYDQLEADPE